MPTTDQRLFDMIIRHQVYLEAFKDYQTNEIDVVLSKLATEFRTTFASTDKTQMKEFTRVEMKRLLDRLRQLQATQYTRYVDDQLRTLERFSSVDRDIAIGIVGAVTAVPRSLPSAERLWSRIRNEPIAATGDLLSPFIVGLTNNALRQVDNIVRRSYAHGLSVSETATTVIGTKQRNYRDGFFGKFKRWNKAVLSSAIQHVAMLALSDISSKVFERYEWVSVMDEKTSAICIDYDGQIFRYGNGPLPPAHPNCRSAVVPLVGTGRTMPTFQQWYGGQSSAFKQEAKQPISLEQFTNKRQRIIEGE